MHSMKCFKMRQVLNLCNSRHISACGMSRSFSANGSTNHEKKVTSKNVKGRFSMNHLGLTGGGFGSFSSSSLLQGIGHQNFKAHQQRNFSSVTNYINQGFTVSAAEIGKETTAVTGAGPSTSGEAVNVIPTTAADSLIDGVEYIPLPPTPVLETVDPLVLNALGEATLKSLGLAGWSPIGIMQQFIEFIHVTADTPWWLAIVGTTLLIRLSVVPVVVYSQRASAHMANLTPQMQALQKKVSDAKEVEDHLSVSKHSAELQNFMKSNNLNPLKSAVMPLIQMPIFMSMFFALRRMASLPVLSMTTGGAFWFSDLTITDPTYMLPLLTTVTMMLSVHVSLEMSRNANTSAGMALAFRVMKFVPMIMFPIMMNFPSALVVYWCTTNVVTLVQGPLLKVPAIRSALKIPQLVVHQKKKVNGKDGEKESIPEAIKSAYKNYKAMPKRQDRHRMDEERRYRAATGPVPRTFKDDPTKGRL